TSGHPGNPAGPPERPTPMATTTRAYSYIRFSTPTQLKGDSLRRQLEWSAGLARAKGWHLDESLTLQALGVSAFRGRNGQAGALARFLDAVRQGRVGPGSVLIVESLDRLSRAEVRRSLKLFIDILEMGVYIATRVPERVYAPDADMLEIMEAVITM